jgi:hypothetical protein
MGQRAMTTLAVIPYARGFQIDELMAALAGALKQRGLRLGGVVQHNQGPCETGCAAMVLEDLATGARFPISAPRGPLASGCVLDTAGLAAAGGAVLTALDHDIDLLLVNKFGRQEMLGQGLRQEIAAGLAAGLPVLLAVRTDWLDAWRAFAGDDWIELPADTAAVEAWALAHATLAA